MSRIKLISRNFSILRPINPSLCHVDDKIRAFVQQGLYFEAIESYSKESNILFDTSKFVFPSLFKACAHLSNVHYGGSLHSAVIKMGLQFDPYITTSIVHMYVKCGWVSSAVNLFDNVSQCEILAQDVGLWNSIIDGLLKNGIFEEGMVHFRGMQALDVKPDGYTICILLGTCARLLGIAYGEEIHGYVVRNSFDRDAFVVTALMDMYSNFKRPLDAWFVFKKLENKSNVAVWNAMINGFCENGFGGYGLHLYSLAKTDRLELGSTTFSSALTACSLDDDIYGGCQLHCDVVKAGFENDTYVNTSLITLYAKCGYLNDAERIFVLAVDKEVEVWNSMISAYVNDGRGIDALHVYGRMRFRMVEPDSFTVSNTLIACRMIGMCDLGRTIHGELIKKPITQSVSVQSALLTMYSKLGIPNDAHKVFTDMKEKDVIAWGSIISSTCEARKFNEALDLYKAMENDGVKPDYNIMATTINACVGFGHLGLACCIHGLVIKKGQHSDSVMGSSLIEFYSKSGLPDMAQRAFSDVLLKNLVVWNSLISCYCLNGFPVASLGLIPQILHHGLYPDAVSITSVLPAVSSMAALLKGKAIHCYYIRFQIPDDILVDNALMDMYIKCGCLKYAKYLFRNMPKNNLISWNSVIDGFGSHGECHKAIDMFQGMMKSGVAPDEITFLSLISSCNHCGLVDEGLEIFQRMKEHEVEVKMEHCVNIVDLLGRAGRLNDACDFVENMKMAPDRGIWLSLLSSCRVHRNVELGELAADRLVKMDPTRCSNYIQLLNLYTETGMQEKAAKMRALMRQKGLNKVPGCSWIEVTDKVDIFYSGDSSSPATVRIHETLNNIKNYMKRKDFNLEAGKIMYEAG